MKLCIIKKNPIISVMIATAFAIYLLSLPIMDVLYRFLTVLNSTLLCFVLLSKTKMPFSMQKMVNLFILFFFVIANAIQYSSNSIITSLEITFSEGDYLRFQLLVFIIIVGFNVVYRQFYCRYKINHDGMSAEQIKVTPLIILSNISFIIVLIYFRGNWLNMFFRGLSGEFVLTLENNREYSQIEGLIFDHFIRIIPAICYYYVAISKCDKKTRLITFMIFFLSDFPLSLSRNAVALLWIPVLFIKFRIIYRPNMFVYVMIAGLLIIFPFLDNFRHFNGEVEFRMRLDYLNSMHFDASQNFMALIKLHTITYGRQLLGAVLFFVPRSIWPTKPTGSGFYLADKQGVFSNISMPYFAEGFINFGYFGIFLFVILFAVFSAIIDKQFWSGDKVFTTAGNKIVYFILVGATFFIMRGDLMSSLAYTVGSLFSVYFVGWVQKHYCKRSKVNSKGNTNSKIG